MSQTTQFAKIAVMSRDHHAPYDQGGWAKELISSAAAIREHFFVCVCSCRFYFSGVKLKMQCGQNVELGQSLGPTLIIYLKKKIDQIRR